MPLVRFILGADGVKKKDKAEKRISHLIMSVGSKFNKKQIACNVAFPFVLQFEKVWHRIGFGEHLLLKKDFILLNKKKKIKWYLKSSAEKGREIKSLAFY